MPRKRKVIVTIFADRIEVSSPYSEEFRSWLYQSVPRDKRQFNGTDKTWVIDIDYIRSTFGSTEQIISALRQIYPDREFVIDHKTKQGKSGPQEREFILRYLGVAKARNSQVESATGYTTETPGTDSTEGNWNLIFPRKILEKWFKSHKTSTKRKPETYYEVLELTSDDLAGLSESEAKKIVDKAFRQLSKMYHPDQNKEECAHEQFILLTTARDVLGNPQRRIGYDVGLLMKKEQEQLFSKKGEYATVDFYRAPVKNGRVRAIVEQKMGKWVVKEILSWDKIVDPNGRELTVVWDKVQNTIKEYWQ